MIAVRLEGRLGNQLFQYAFIYAAAQQVRTGFYLDKSVTEFTVARYFEVKTDFLKPADALFGIKGFKHFFSITLKKAFYRRLQKLIFKDNTIIIDNEMPVQEALNNLHDDHLYIGYFQSQQYFNKVQTQLRQSLRVKKAFTTKFDAIANQLPPNQKTIVIHIRRGDYVGLKWTLPVSYYKTALETAEYQNALCIFISDDREYIEQQFGYISNKYISHHSEIIDLQFMINADVCVLSASSFSWWGAWLNHKKNKQIFAPKNWLGFATGTEYPTSIADCLDYNWIDAYNHA